MALSYTPHFKDKNAKKKNLSTNDDCQLCCPLSMGEKALQAALQTNSITFFRTESIQLLLFLDLDLKASKQTKNPCICIRKWQVGTSDRLVTM